MDKQQKWIEAIKNLPTWVGGAIGLTTAIISFVVLLQKNYYLGATILGLLLLATTLCLCIYLAFAKTPPLVAGGKGVYRFESYRPWALVGIVLITTIAGTTLMYKPSRSFVITAFVGTATPTPTLTPIPTPPPTLTPSSTPTSTPESFDESYFGILIASFVCGATEREVCVEGADLAQIAYDNLLRRIEQESMSSRIDVRRVGPVLDDEEAKTVGEQYGAQMVVWGYVPTNLQYDQKSFVPYFTLLASTEKLIAVDPVLFEVWISGLETLELSQQLSARVTGVSTFILSMVYLTEDQPGDYEQAVRMLDLSVESAMQELKGVAEDDPRRDDLEYTLATFYAIRGRAYAAVGDEQGAYNDYQTALEYNSDTVRAQIGLANYHFSRGELVAAQEAFETARRLDPMSYRAYYGLAITAYARGDYREAETLFKRVVELASARDANVTPTYFALGLTYLQLKELEEARIEFQRALSNENVPRDLRDAAANYLTLLTTCMEIQQPQSVIPPPAAPMTTSVPSSTTLHLPPILGEATVFHCDAILEWQWLGTLAEDEYFAVRVWRKVVGIELHCIVAQRWTKAQSYMTRMLFWESGEYSWEIAICRGDPPTDCKQLVVSEQGSFLLGEPCIPTPPPQGKPTPPPKPPSP